MKNDMFDNCLKQREIVFCILRYALAISIFIVLNMSLMDYGFCQLDSLLHSHYEYSANTQDKESSNCYIQYDAEIDFLIAEDALTCLNAEVIMQSDTSIYTDIVDWGVQRLSVNGIAISKGLSLSSKLKLGDKLFSKHLADGKERSYTVYTVEQIVSNVKNTRVSSKQIETDGIIIMGYDKQYDENIKHNYIMFFDGNSEEERRIPILSNTIIHRTDEIKIIAKKIIPYIFLSLIVCAVIFIQTRYIVKVVLPYYTLLLSRGYKLETLNRSLRCLIFRIGGLTILTAFVCEIIVSCAKGFSLIKFIYLFTICTLEIFSVLFFERIIEESISKNNGGKDHG